MNQKIGNKNLIQEIFIGAGWFLLHVKRLFPPLFGDVNFIINEEIEKRKYEFNKPFCNLQRRCKFLLYSIFLELKKSHSKNEITADAGGLMN